MTNKEKLKFLNIKRLSNEASLPSADSLPTLIPDRAYKAITEQENSPLLCLLVRYALLKLKIMNAE